MVDQLQAYQWKDRSLSFKAFLHCWCFNIMNSSVDPGYGKIVENNGTIPMYENKQLPVCLFRLAK